MRIGKCYRCEKKRVLSPRGLCNSCRSYFTNKKSPNLKENLKRWREKNKDYWKTYWKKKRLTTIAISLETKKELQQLKQKRESIHKTIINLLKMTPILAPETTQKAIQPQTTRISINKKTRRKLLNIKYNLGYPSINQILKQLIKEVKKK